MGLAAACAQQGIPPGGPEDRRPPVVVATVPDTFEIVSGFEGPVRFDFDERISERVNGGSLDQAVLISPKTGEVRVRHERQSLMVELDGGFQDGVVYRVTLRPVVRDLFNNELRDPFELVFSTGEAPIPTTIAGIAWDRVTGRGAAGFEVRAIPTEGDSTPHIAMADTGGVFAFRYVPAGRFSITAFEDRNGDGVVDPGETKGTRRGLVGAGDTLSPVIIPVLAADTTPAVITALTPLDSMIVLVDFDDYLDPDVPLAGLGVSLHAEDGTNVPVDRILHAHEYERWIDVVEDSIARLDSIDAALRPAAPEATEEDSAAAQEEGAAADPDSAALVPADDVPPPEFVQLVEAPAPTDTVTIGAPVQEAAPARRSPPRIASARSVGRRGPASSARSVAPGTTGPGGERLPDRSIVVILAAPLSVNVPYQVTVTAVRNLNSVPLGGGEAVLVLEPPPSAGDSAVGESGPGDTASAQDTTSVPDTALGPDTAAVPPAAVTVGRRGPYIRRVTSTRWVSRAAVARKSPPIGGRRP